MTKNTDGMGIRIKGPDPDFYQGREYIGYFPGLGHVPADFGVSKTLEWRISRIRQAAEEAIKRAEEGAEMANKYLEVPWEGDGGDGLA